MVQLGVIDKAARIAWSPACRPILAAGTVAGAIDLNFTDGSSLELYELKTEKDGKSAFDKVGSIETEAKFYDIDWIKQSADQSDGIIAGALENGTISIWDAGKIINSSNGGSSLIRSFQGNESYVRALRFNRQTTKLLASVGANSKIDIWDFASGAPKTYYEAKSTREEELSCVSWNQRVPHIIAAGGMNGFTTIWELKTKKEIIHLSNSQSTRSGSKAVSAIQWHPDNPTKIVTAYEDDASILVWDLRNARSPERNLTGHELGVLDLSWSTMDSDLLLSAGKDNRTILWNPSSGEIMSSFTRGVNWSFQALWSISHPDILASASYDVGIAAHSIQTALSTADINQRETPQANDTDFFNQLPAVSGDNKNSLNLKKAPKWLLCPSSVYFSANNELLIVTNTEAGAKLSIRDLELKTELGSEIEKFEKSIDTIDIEKYCKDLIDSSSDPTEKRLYEMLTLFMKDNPRSLLKEHLTPESKTGEQENQKVNLEKTGSIDISQSIEKSYEGDAEEFIKSLSLSSDEKSTDIEKPSSAESDASSVRGKPFNFSRQNGSEIETILTNYVLQGDFDGASKICLEKDMYSEAFLFASCGSEESRLAVRKQFTRANAQRPFIRLVSSVADRDFGDIIMNVDTSDWKQSLSLLCTYASPNDFSRLSTMLGSRLEDSDHVSAFEDAALCYMAGSNLEKLVDLFIKKFAKEEAENIQARNGATKLPLSLHEDNIVKLVQKVSILLKALNLDRDGVLEGQNLTKLFAIYLQYAGMLLDESLYPYLRKYLDLIPNDQFDGEWLKKRLEMVMQKHSYVGQKSAAHAHVRQAMPHQSGMVVAGLDKATELQPALQNPYAIQRPANEPQQLAVPNQYAPQHYVSEDQVPELRRAGHRQVPNEVGDLGWNDAPRMSLSQRRATGQHPSVKAITSPFPNLPDQRVLTPPPQSNPTSASVTPPHENPPPSRPTQQDQTRPYSATGPAMNGSAYNQPPMYSSRAAAPVPLPPPKAGTPIPAAGPVPAVVTPQLNNGQQYGHQQQPQQLQMPAEAQMYVPQQDRSRSSSVTSNPYAPVREAMTPSSRAEMVSPHVAPMQQQRVQPVVGPPQTMPAPRKSGTVNSSQATVAKKSPDLKYPEGDREHMAPAVQPIYRILTSEFSKVKEIAPPSTQRQINDIERRLNILFDYLNNSIVLSAYAIERMLVLVEAMAAGDYKMALATHIDLVTTHTEECGQWMVGVKRLIELAKMA